MTGVVDVSGEELLLMIRLSNFFSSPANHIQFTSLDHIGRRFENSIRPSRKLQYLLAKMLKLRFLRVNEVNMIEFDVDSFDVFVEGHEFGREMWTYFDIRATYVRTKP
jgi:hypothetical protein